VEVTSGRVVDHVGDDHEGSLVIVCPGDAHTGLGGAVGAALAHAPVRRCRLQMMQTAPTDEILATSVADGDSMRYYPAFDLPGRTRLPVAPDETMSSGMQLLLVQRAAGGLTIGDTHVYEEPFDFAVEEFLYERLRQRAEEILGWSLPPVVRRWAGVYSAAIDDRVCVREEVESGVVVVTGLAGRGMTLSPAIAEQTWDRLWP
ncbi:MAG TPA: FAD-dependent oxidoreductase, partial [Acidimicrobiales bacterium]|nr:FAD-dependent oxidoreductase [Acidimicrobiales bacterium]